MTHGPSSSAFVSFLSYCWLFNVATSFVNGPLLSTVFAYYQLNKQEMHYIPILDIPYRDHGDTLA